MTIGEQIKIHRKEKGLTQEELGNILGVKKSAVQKYENGSIQNLKLDTIKKLCDTFEIYPWELIYAGEFENKERWLKEETRMIEFMTIAYGSLSVDLIEVFITLDESQQQSIVEHVKALASLNSQDLR